MEILDYCTAGGKNLITGFIDSLPQNSQLMIKDIRKELAYGNHKTLQKFTTRQIKGKVWELKYSDIRIFYVLIDENTIVFLHICKKQKNKTEEQNRKNRSAKSH